MDSSFAPHEAPGLALVFASTSSRWGAISRATRVGPWDTASDSHRFDPGPAIDADGAIARSLKCRKCLRINDLYRCSRQPSDASRLLLNERGDIPRGPIT